jgi:hypothetical protein
MKKSLLVIISFSLTISLNAQVVKIDTIKSQDKLLQPKHPSSRNEQYLYTIGLKALGYEQFPKILNQANSTSYKNIPFNGVIFKFNDNQISYRISGNFYNKNFSFKNDCDDCEIAIGKLTDYSIKLGFEKLITYSTIQPYFAIDIGFRNNRFKGSSQNASSINYTTLYDVTAEKNAGIVSPAIGIKLNLINHFTIAVEGSMDILRNYERQEKTYQDGNRTRGFEKDSNWEYLLRPVGIFLLYNFGAGD